MKNYRAELLRSGNRGTLWFLVLCLALTVFSMLNAKPQHHDPLWGFQQAGIFVGTLLMGRAATVTANDFSSGTIRSWLISSPSRGGVALGKLAASVTVALGFSLVAGVVGYAFSCVLGTVPTLSQTASVTGELAVGSVALTLFGSAVGLITRSVPVALTLVLAWILAGENVLNGRLAHADQWLPGLVAHEITLGKLVAGSTYPSAIAHAVIPFLLLEVVAVVHFLRRDVNS